MSDTSQMHMAIAEHTKNPAPIQVDVDQTVFSVLMVTDFNVSP